MSNNITDSSTDEIEILGGVIEGHKIASGVASNNPYPEGALKMQMPFFKARGINFGDVHYGTINISIAPYRFKIIKPDYFLSQVEWTKLHPPENFSFIACAVNFGTLYQQGFIYYPHPETKKNHFTPDYIFEILTGYINGIKYGEKIKLKINLKKISIFK